MFSSSRIHLNYRNYTTFGSNNDRLVMYDLHVSTLEQWALMHILVKAWNYSWCHNNICTHAYFLAWHTANLLRLAPCSLVVFLKMTLNVATCQHICEIFSNHLLQMFKKVNPSFRTINFWPFINLVSLVRSITAVNH